MLTARGIAAAFAGLAMWLVARLIGSPGLEVVGVGLASLPIVAALYARFRRRRIAMRRRLSEVRVAPGTRVTVTLDLENRSVAPTTFLLVEDRLPPPLGRSARLVVSGIAGRTGQRVAYSILPQARGRYRLGPLAVDVQDAFGLTRHRLEFDQMDELLVTPEIEDLTHTPDPAFGPNVGSSRTRQLFRTGEEYFTMRQYQQGDDLRRIHWASVARTGELMIRQDESSRRASGLVFVDNRSSAIGQSYGPAFERAVSVAASVGALLANGGFGLRLGTADGPAVPVSDERFMDALAGLSHVSTRSVAPALARLRAAASADVSLVFVSGMPSPSELTALLRAGSGFGPRLAVLVYPVDPRALPADRQAQLEGRATQARLAFTRANWDCIVLSPTTKLAERWHTPRERPLAYSV
jgi:uncharacterized protein (DUF58 family)